MTSGAIIVMMAVLFVGLGYLGVPVAFSIMAGRGYTVTLLKSEVHALSQAPR